MIRMKGESFAIACNRSLVIIIIMKLALHRSRTSFVSPMSTWCPGWWSKRRPCTLVQTNLVGAPSPDFRLCFPLMTYEGRSAGPRPLGDEPYMHL